MLGSLPLLRCFPSAAQVACEALYYAACVRRLRPEDQDVLVEFPRVERVVQRVSKVRPPQGFALSQARQQARKVHMLHTMLKVGESQSGATARTSALGLLLLLVVMAFCLIFQNFLVYMFFLLVVLLLNYSDSDRDAHSLRLRTQLQRALHTPEDRGVSRYTCSEEPSIAGWRVKTVIFTWKRFLKPFSYL